MLFIMSDISPVEGTPLSGLDSAEKPSQDTLRGVFDLFTKLAKKPSALPLPFRPGVNLRVQSDSTIIPIIINNPCWRTLTSISISAFGWGSASAWDIYPCMPFRRDF